MAANTALKRQEFREFSLQPQPLVSVIIPLYNEAKRIDILKEGIVEFLEKCHSFNYEIILVNDGSKDSTGAEIEDLAQELNQSHHANLCTQVIALDLTKNQGKGGALRQGVLAAQGQWVLTLDADMATPITQLLEWQEDGCIDLFSAHSGDYVSKIYIGSRRHEDTKNGILRSIMSATFNFMTRSIVGIDQKDTQCGFKLYPIDVAKNCFVELKEFGWAHDIEIIKRAEINGAETHAVPVKWKAVGGSQISVVRDSSKMFFSLFKIKKYITSDYEI